MRKYIIYELAMNTGAGDEPLAVDYDRANLTAQQLEYEGYTKIYEIDFDEYVECLFYLGYSVEDELRAFGRWIEKNKADYRERKGDVEVVRRNGEIKYCGYWTDPEGRELHKLFDKIEDADKFASEPRFYVTIDYQGGSFGMNRNYTIEQWREQAIEWLDQDGAEADVIEHWQKMPAEQVIDSIADWWQLKIDPCRKSKLVKISKNH